MGCKNDDLVDSGKTCKVYDHYEKELVDEYVPLKCNNCQCLSWESDEESEAYYG